MTVATKPTTVRFDERDKAEATEILNGMGLSLNSYLNLSVKQLILRRKIPFEIEAPEEAPNETTRRAMVAAEAKSLGLIPDDSPAFDDVDELIEYLES